jgi:alkyl sulfatase BDS1-like metallo-beta-lactamase superfamily hydrolase
MVAVNARPTVHADLAAQAAKMTSRIFVNGGNVHTAYAYAPSNCTMIEGDDGVVLVDTLSTVELAQPVAQAFREMTSKPIKAVIYTHFHADHVSGIHAFVSEDDVRNGVVEVIAHESLVDNVVQSSGLLAPILGRRAMFTFGFQLPVGPEGNVGSGFGPVNFTGTRSFFEPTRTFRSTLDLKICGLNLQLVHVPTETDDQIVVWLPDQKILLSADAIQGETFPNIYAIRGTPFRNPMIWVRGIDRLRSFQAEILIPHHGRPVAGAQAVEDVLVAHRDAIQYLHDQTVRWMNRGCTPDEIAEKVVMPAHLAAHAWLGEFYGAYKHCTRGIYSGYLGWFEGDPITLDPLPRVERARRYVDLLGGRMRVLDVARAAFAKGEFQWSAELVTWLIRADPADGEACQLKAAALREFGYRQKNANWRNWSLTSALELEGKIKSRQLGLPMGSPETVGKLPLARVLRTLAVRLKAEKCTDIDITVGFEAIDTGESCALQIRRGVCQFHEQLPARLDAKLCFERKFLTGLLFETTTIDAGVQQGQAIVDGDAKLVCQFWDKFETLSEAGEIRIAVR